MALPRISVAMPVYNGGDDLRVAVASVLAQSFTDWELILIDDGSTDGVLDTLDLSDPRIRLVRDGRNFGLAARLNQAIELARGHFFARMDADDVSHPERFARQVAFLDSTPEVDLLGVRSVVIDWSGRVVGDMPFRATHSEICAAPWRGFYLVHPSWMGRTAWFRRHRYADPAPYYCEDQELLLRTYTESCFAALPEALFAYRTSGSLPWAKLRRARRAFRQVEAAHWRGRKRITRLTLDGLRFGVDVLSRFRGGSRRGKISAEDRVEWEGILARLIR